MTTTATATKIAYVSFNMPGCDVTITAKREFEKIDDIKSLPASFRITLNPVKNAALNMPLDAINLFWSALDRPDGTEHTCARWMFRRFNELRTAGWVIDDAAFIAKHFRPKS
jgi:hypothetical protein